jgi:ABC-type transporter Mla subunit MlaD
MDIDVHSYQEELDTIVNDAKAVLARMDEMKHRFDAVAAKVDEVEHLFGTVKTEIDQHVNATASNIETWFQHAQERIGQFDTQVTQAYQQAMADLVSKIAAAEQLFGEKAGSAYQAVDKSHSIVQQLGELVKSTDHEVADGVRTGIHTVQDDIAQLKQQFDGTTHPSMTTLDDLLGHTQQQAEAYTHETHDHLEQLKQETDDHIQQNLFQPMQMHLGETAQKLGQIATGDVDGKLHEVMQQARENLEAHAKQVISNLVDKVAAELDQVSDHIHQAGQSSAIPREAMKPIIDGIEQLLKPVEETIGNVKSVAAAVGFDV